MKKIILISTLLALCFSARAQMEASFAGGFDLGASVTKSSEFFHFVQVGGMSVGLEFSLYPGMKSTIDGYTVTRDSVSRSTYATSGTISHVKTFPKWHRYFC